MPDLLTIRKDLSRRTRLILAVSAWLTVVIAWFGLHWTLFAMGALYLLATLSILVNPKMKNMNRAPLAHT